MLLNKFIFLKIQKILSIVTKKIIKEMNKFTVDGNIFFINIKSVFSIFSKKILTIIEIKLKKNKSL